MIIIGADRLVTLSGLIDNSNSTYQNAATVSGSLLSDDRLTTITTFTLTYVSASNGNYQGTIPASITSTLTPSTNYRIVVTAVSSGFTFEIEDRDTAGYNTNN